MLRITPDQAWPLFDVAATRRLEQAAAAGLAPHALMQRAGLAVARLAMAVAPHARRIWIACGPGNNGGDGLEAAVHLKAWGREPVITWLASEATAPPDALAAWHRARAAQVRFEQDPPPGCELVIDALLGIGSARPASGRMAEWLAAMAQAPKVVAVDLPSGLDADTGTGEAPRAHHTLCLLTLKPGLFTAQGRDRCGTVWLDDLGVASADALPSAWLGGPPTRGERPHAAHKGSYGDVAVIGGAAGMTGAALLAGSAALHSGAGRVFVGLLDAQALSCQASLPDLMLRPWETLPLAEMHVACGCGGGDAVRAALPRVLGTACSLVLDADGLNACAGDPQLQHLLQSRGRRAGHVTVLTPHPLEAARLLGTGTVQVQADRVGSAAALAQRYQCTVVLKGSGTVIATRGKTPVINPTGNARLAIAGTGDVLAGMVAARLASGAGAFEAACAAVYTHGRAADAWPTDLPLTASALARRH